MKPEQAVGQAVKSKAIKQAIKPSKDKAKTSQKEKN